MNHREHIEPVLGRERRELADYFIARLEQLIELDRWDGAALPTTRALLWHAFWSTYEDCVSLGFRHQADDLRHSLAR